MVAPKPSGFPNTKEGKAAILARTRALVEKSSIIITVPIQGVAKEQIDLLRVELPAGVKATVVKNALLRKAVTGTQFEALGAKVRDETMYFFIPEGAAKKSYEVYKKWQKEVKRAEPEFDAKYAAMEGLVYDGKGVETVANLPTRAEVFGQLARGIKSVPLKLVRTVKAVPNKVGYAFNAVKTKMEEEAKSTSA